jgi:hypothetical protein
MPTTTARDNALRRLFRDIPPQSNGEISASRLFDSPLWPGTLDWVELLKSMRVLIVAEAGAGKTFECQQKQSQLYAAGQPAFFIELAQLATTDLADLLSPDECDRLSTWKSSQADVATFFLDSIDELGLTSGTFRAAVIRLSKAIQGKLQHAKVVITTRPVPFDRYTVERYLPIPSTLDSEADNISFTDVVMRTGKQATTVPTAQPVRHVLLLPLTSEQIHAMVRSRGIASPDDLIDEISRTNAFDLARRPQDLIEMCASWQEHGALGTHSEQVHRDIVNKLKPRTDRSEPDALSPDRAFEGASRLALAMSLTRRLTIRHDVNADTEGAPGETLDPDTILFDWSKAERDTLLQRSLFGFASYGRVRFHHRSVWEFLAAQRLLHLTETRGMSINRVRHRLFVRTFERTDTLRPSMRAVAAWVALGNARILELMRDADPHTLLSEGDPKGLTSAQLTRVFDEYVERYACEGWNGKHVQRLQIERFACPALAAAMQKRWEAGISNPEVRRTILLAIGYGRIAECREIVVSIAFDPAADEKERRFALDALVQLKDASLSTIPDALCSDTVLWPNTIAAAATLSLFPAHLTVAELLRILRQRTSVQGDLDLFAQGLPQVIRDAAMSPADDRELLIGICALIRDGLTWDNPWQPASSPRAYLIPPLVALCSRQLVVEHANASDRIVPDAVALAACVSDRSGGSRDETAELRQLLHESSPNVRAAVFAAENALHEQFRMGEPRADRAFQILRGGHLDLTWVGDHAWLVATVIDAAEPPQSRELALHALLWLGWDQMGERREDFENLRDRVAAVPILARTIDERLNPTPRAISEEVNESRAQLEESVREGDTRKKELRAQWEVFVTEVRRQPDEVFSPDRARSTAINLWLGMRHSDVGSNHSLWNRRFIEQHFDTTVANRLRDVMQRAWRAIRPTLWSERSPSERNLHQSEWLYGLAGVYANAENLQWANELTDEEAKLAARYVPLDLGGFPPWLPALCDAHPAAVDSVLGAELDAELRASETTDSHSPLMQNLSHATAGVAVMFVSRLLAWLEQPAAFNDAAAIDVPGDQWRLRTAISTVLQHGDAAQRENIRRVAAARVNGTLDQADVLVWLDALFLCDAAEATSIVETALDKDEKEAKAGNAESLSRATGGISGPRLQADNEHGSSSHALVELPDVVDLTLSDTERQRRPLGVTVFAYLFGDRHEWTAARASLEAMPIDVVLRLVRLAYRHVPPSADLVHTGGFTPGLRDNAESARNRLLTTLLDARGHDAWLAKLELVKAPELAHFSARAIVIAKEQAALEADAEPLSEAAAVSIERYGEAPPRTAREMFELMQDRLDDIDDLLEQDASPREAWASLSQEHLVRRELARALESRSNGMYVVDQEAVTAAEKETDIRLRSTASDVQAVIELKLGQNGWSTAALEDALSKQLVGQYMQPESRRSGCLLVAIPNKRSWKHPVTGDALDGDALMLFLQDRANQIVGSSASELHLVVRALDLRC